MLAVLLRFNVNEHFCQRRYNNHDRCIFYLSPLW